MHVVQGSPLLCAPVLAGCGSTSNSPSAVQRTARHLASGPSPSRRKLAKEWTPEEAKAVLIARVAVASNRAGEVPDPSLRFAPCSASSCRTASRASDHRAGRRQTSEAPRRCLRKCPIPSEFPAFLPIRWLPKCSTDHRNLPALRSRQRTHLCGGFPPAVPAEPLRCSPGMARNESNRLIPLVRSLLVVANSSESRTPNKSRSATALPSVSSLTPSPPCTPPPVGIIYPPPR